MSSENRRNFRRLPIQASIEIWTDHESWNGTLVNQSIGGVGLTLDAVPTLQIGDAIRARYEGAEAFGYIRYIRKEDNGGVYLGVSWDQREQPRKERNESANFFVDGPLEVVCRACDPIEADQVRFELWDGTTFSADNKCITERTISERESHLSTNVDELAKLVKLYKLGRTRSPDEALERVVDFEFTR